MPKAQKLGAGTLVFGEVGDESNFAVLCTNVTLTPSSDSEDDGKYLDGTARTGEETETWEIGGNVDQSYETDSLQAWAFNNRYSKTLTPTPFKFVPLATGVQSWTGECKVRPMVIGGDVDAKNGSEFAYPVIGSPVLGTNGAGG
ncbi:hypothetical protein CVCC1112_2624 [Paenarthrobacter nicotinovorans]|uniref:hypothetical protein n=1 Tax=Paenarthrobacter nicotinovorans TaxID=29320 RepID=UPI0007CD0BAC|nr:hypothetical protein [Paenarthrobacter nicotinovorans]GAT87965.1 hypothetical protein CVCC1112_2624 [Paenarthrobacter nicotinovorans]